MPMNIKAGQHTVFWGDSLLLSGAIHGVSYAQNSLDILKGFATPGAEAKELFRPRGGLTLQLQPTTDLSLAAQWFYNWQAVRAPESGSYLTAQDGLQFGGDSIILGANPFAAAFPGSPALARAWNNQGVAPSRYSASLGDWGISARWSPAWLDGTLGFYFRNATDILPQVVLTPRPRQRPLDHRQDAVLRQRDVRSRADLDALDKVTQNPAVFTRPRQLHRDRQAVARLRRPRLQRHADLVPGAAGRGPAGADLLFARL